jgi:hypothetical protein
MTQIQNLFESLEFRIWILPFDMAQGGEPVEPFVICYLVLGLRRAQSCRIFSIMNASVAFKCAIDG